MSNIYFSNIEKDRFPGFCVDIGAPRLVIGSRSLDIFFKILNTKTILRITSGNSFRSGDVTFPSLGMVKLWLKVPAPRHSLALISGIVQVNVAPLLGLDVLNSEQLYGYNVTNRPLHRQVLSANEELLKFIDR